MDITELLAFTVKNKASDLHISAGLPPMIRVDGDIHRINTPAIENKEMAELVYSTMNDHQRRDYERAKSRLSDFSLQAYAGLARLTYVRAFQSPIAVGSGSFSCGNIPTRSWTTVRYPIGTGVFNKDTRRMPRG